nr:DNA helicase [Tanacetum cinerariifolium]
MEEKSYDRTELAKEVDVLKPKLNACQRRIYDWITDSTAKEQQELIFVYGHGGRTAHSRFKLPLDLTDE